MIYKEAIDPEPTYPTLFLGGGITNCPDWQQEICGELQGMDLTVYNPRRADFPIGDPDAAEAQIIWEYKLLEKADAIMFWFPEETLCPITLFELGAHLYSAPLFVGCHLGYARKLDVEIQVGLARPEVTVHTSIASLGYEIRDWLWAEESS